LGLYQRHGFGDGGLLALAQASQIGQGLQPAGRCATSNFPDDQRVRQDQISFKQIHEVVVAELEVINPDRGVDQHASHASAASRRRGMSCIAGVLPPRRASRLADCTRTKVLTASRKRSALSMSGSATSSARSYSWSSIVTVVRIPFLEP